MSATPPTETAVVPVKDAWFAKINWTQVVTIVFAILTYSGATVPSDLEPAVLTAITAIGGVLTIVFRTWFNASTTKQSLSR